MSADPSFFAPHLWSLHLLRTAWSGCTPQFLGSASSLLGLLLFSWWVSTRRTRLLWGWISLGLFVVLAAALRDTVYLVGDSRVWISAAETYEWRLPPYRAPLFAVVAGFLTESLEPLAAASRVLAWLSTLCGLLVAVTLVFSLPGRQERGALLPVIGILVFCQPLSFIFYGHIESYPLLCLCATAFLVSVHGDLRGGKPRAVTAGLLVAAVLVHYSALLLILPLAAWFLARRYRGRLVLWYAAGLAGLATTLLAVPALRGYTLLAGGWTTTAVTDYGIDLLNAWFLMLVPGTIILWPVRREVFSTEFGRVLGLMVLTVALFPLLARFELGGYRDLDLLSLGLAPITYLLLLGLAGRKAFATIWAGALLGAAFLIAIVVLGRCPAGAGELQKHLARSAMTAEARANGHEVLSYYHRERGSLVSAREQMEKALAATPGNLRLWGPLGELQAELGDTAAAIGSLERALSSSRAVRTAPLLAELLIRTGRPDHALEVLREVGGGVYQSQEASAALAVAFMRLGEPDSTLAAARHRLDIEPEDPVAHFNAASALLRLGRPEDSIVELRLAASFDPGNVRYHRLLLQLLLRLPDGERLAQEHLDTLPPGLIESVLAGPRRDR